MQKIRASLKGITLCVVVNEDRCKDEESQLLLRWSRNGKYQSTRNYNTDQKEEVKVVRWYWHKRVILCANDWFIVRE